MKKLISIICVIAVFAIILPLSSCNKNYDESVTAFQLNEKGEFKILTIADLHFMNNNSIEDENMLERMEFLINETEPELLIILGDLVYSDVDRVEALRVLIDIIDSYKIPWAPVYGNHDPENPKGILYTSKAEAIANKQAMNKLFEKSTYCLFEEGPEDIQGYGNYIINIEDGNDIIQTLFFMDSNDYVRKEDVNEFDYIPKSALDLFRNYGTIYKDQIEWYEEKVKDISDYQYNGKKTVPSLAFFHIPLPEYKTVWELYENNSSEVKHYDGKIQEIAINNNGGVSSPSFNTGMFDKMVELGSTKAVFVGHDHANDFSIEYKGIRLNYNGGMRHITYTVSDDIVESMFGGRLVTIKSDGSLDLERKLISDMS